MIIPHLRITSYIIPISNPLNPWPYDNFENYISSSNLSGSNLGWSWNGIWMAGGYFANIYAYDSMETYLTSSAVSESNGGIGSWSGGYLSN